ncbi:MAG: hypothetical protein QM500_10900 [Methylococcales bacterium]
MKYILIFAVFLMSGCMGPGKFAVKQSVSDPIHGGTEVVLTSTNNRVSNKDPDGNYYAYQDGLYLNPYVAKDKGQALIGFDVTWTSTRTTLAGLNGNNPASVGPLMKMDIKADDVVYSFNLKNQEFRHGGLEANQFSDDVSLEEQDSATATLSKLEYEAIMNATNLVIEITGTSGSFYYKEELLAEHFKKNLKSFYDSHL